MLRIPYTISQASIVLVSFIYGNNSVISGHIDCNIDHILLHKHIKY